MKDLVDYKKLDQQSYICERAAKTQFLVRYSEIPGAKIIQCNKDWCIVKSEKERR